MDVLDIVIAILFFGWLICVGLQVNSIDKTLQDLNRDLHALSADIARLQRSVNALSERPNRFYIPDSKS